MFKKVLLGIGSIVLLSALSLLIYVEINWDKTYDMAYPDLSTSTDSAIIALGEYYVNGPAHCSTCHTADLSGGETFTLGPMGQVTSANLTPHTETGIGRYEDREIFRMMRHAVKPNGRASIALMMPFWNMADDDMVAIVSYLRSIPPVNREIPEPEWTVLGKVLRSFSATFEPVYTPTPAPTAPEMTATIERGEYLTRYVTNCVACHTERDQMTFQAIGPEFAGGMIFEAETKRNIEAGVDPNLSFITPNLTPAEGSALSVFSEQEQWIARFRAGRVHPSSPMSWEWFARMTDADLGAMWVYLNSLDPVDKVIEDVVYIKKDD